MQKPRGDMGALGIPKATASAAVPFAAPAPAVPEPPADTVLPDKSLTVKLKGPEYRALRDHCIARERATGQRVTHQMVMIEALMGCLNAQA